MVNVSVQPGDEVADVKLPGGCIVCGGDLHMRLTPQLAVTVCARCNWIGRAVARFDGDGLKVAHLTVAQA